MKGVVSEQTRRKGDIVTNSKEVLKKRADARFKKDERVREGTKAMLEYEAEGRAVREKTARLRALRLDKEAAEKTKGSQRTPVSRWLPEKRRTMAASNKNTRMQSRLEKAARENHKLSVDYEVQAKIIREKTARLQALRLAKEAAEKKNSGA
jgi:hypothetical protein